MPQALKPLCVIHIGSWEILPTPNISPLGYESQKLEKFKNKIGSKGCKLSSLNPPGTESLVSPSGCENSNFPSSWGIKKLASEVWKSKIGKIWEQNWLKVLLQIIQFAWNQEITRSRLFCWIFCMWFHYLYQKWHMYTMIFRQYLVSEWLTKRRRNFGR